MGKNYKTILMCEKCGKKYSDKWEARRCCEPVVIKKTSQKIPHRSFKFKLCGNIKPRNIKEAFMMLGTCRENVVGYYKYVLRNANMPYKVIINLTNDYIVNFADEPMPVIWNYDFYIEMEVK